MPRYFTKRRACDDDEWPDASPLITDLTVSDHEAIDTGLLDADGNAICVRRTRWGSCGTANPRDST